MNEKTKKGIGWFDKAWQEIVNVSGVLLIISGIGILGYQVFTYLKNGQWVELPLLYLVALGPKEFGSWLVNPTSWLGLHKIVYNLLELIPISIFSILVGSGMAAYQAKAQNA